MMAKKRPTSFSITDQAHDLLDAIAKHYGINKTAALEIIIREKATELHSTPQNRATKPAEARYTPTRPTTSRTPVPPQIEAAARDDDGIEHVPAEDGP
jgi:hypothetical protein